MTVLKENNAEKGGTAEPQAQEPSAWKPGVTTVVTDTIKTEASKKEGTKEERHEPESKSEPAATEPVDAKPSESDPGSAKDAKPGESVPKAEPEPKEDKTREFINLSRKERKLLEERKALEAEKAQIAADRAKIAKIAAVIENAKSDPRAVLEAAGITYDELTKAMLSDGKPDNDLAKRLDAVEGRIKTEEEKKAEAEKKAEEEKREAEWNAGVQQIFVTTEKLIADKKEDYELLHAMGQDGTALVTDIILKYIEKVGKPLPFEQALKLGEEELQAQLKRFSGTKKIQNLFATPSEPPKEDPKEQPSQTPGQPATKRPTLSNSQSTAAPHGQKRKLSRDESLKEMQNLLRYTDA